jgi:uncharacterized protein with beta-barrel porin domain
VTGSTGPVSITLGGSEGGVDGGGALIFSSSGQVLTFGRFAPGVVAQTIGGGGGFGAITAAAGINAPSMSFELGSTGGTGGSADPSNSSIWTIGAGSIMTAGAISDALVAQAIGGGGGLAGFVSGGAHNPPLAAVRLGAAGVSGAGSAVTLTSQSAMLTAGAGAVGILAQSIGGGGGAAQAFGVSAAGPVSLGASGGGGGDAGAVALTSQGAITTSGAGAHGIVAQSIGGGGGFFSAFSSAGSLLSPNVVGVPGAGSGATVAVNVQGAVQTSGVGAHGVIAQSVGGGGGLVGAGEFATLLPAVGSFAGSAGGIGSAGSVAVNVSANILALGADATGIVATSTDATGFGGPINVSVGAGALVVGGLGLGGTPGNGDEPANAVRLIGGSANTLVNNGFLATVGGISGFVVAGGVGDDSIVNSGRIDGSVDLSAGRNAIDNKPAGVFNSGSVVWLGPLPASFDALTNEGLLSPGGYQNVYTTNITGNLLQTATGVYGLDLNLDRSADLINVTGTANMAGNVVLNLVNPLAAPGFATPGTHTETILHAQGGVTNSGLTLTAFDTAVINYSLIYPDSQDIALKYAVDYSPAGLTVNQRTVSYAVNAIETAQLSPAFRPIATNLFYLPNVATLGAAYDSLSGEGVSASEQTAFNATDMFLSTANTQMQRWIQNSCGDDATGTTLYAAQPTPKSKAASPACASARTWRIWGTGYGGTANWSGNGSVGSASVTGRVSGFGAGLDYQINPNFLLGFAAGGGASSFAAQNRATSGTVDAYHTALYGAWRNRNFYASGILSYDWFNDNESRFASIPGVVLPASNFAGGPYYVPGFQEKPGGSFDASAFSAYGEAGYNAHYGLLTATPFVGLEFASLRTGGFTETNQGFPSTVGLSYAAGTTTSLPTFLGLQLEGKGDLPNAMGLDLWVRGAWKHEFDTARSTESAFIAAPGFNFEIQGAQPPRDALVTSVGAKLNVTKNAAVFGTFEGQFGPGANSVAGTGGIMITW